MESQKRQTSPFFQLVDFQRAMRGFFPACMALLFSLIFLLSAVIAPQAHAKNFSTDFISLELPVGWDCVKEEIDYVCQPNNLAQRSEVLLAIVVKNVNATDDTFDKYQAVLNEPREMRDLLGNVYKSEVKYVRFKEIKKKQWVDSLQFGSEIPGFYTRYVASIEGKIAGLVTYSIAESVYAKWAPIMDKILDSIELRYDPKAFDDAMNANPGSLLGRRAQSGGRFAPEGTQIENRREDVEGFDMTNVIGFILLAGAIRFYFWKKKHKS